VVRLGTAPARTSSAIFGLSEVGTAPLTGSPAGSFMRLARDIEMLVGSGSMVDKAMPAGQPAQWPRMVKEAGNDEPDSRRILDDMFVARGEFESGQMMMRCAEATERWMPQDAAAPGDSGGMKMRGAEATECWMPPEGAAPGDEMVVAQVELESDHLTMRCAEATERWMPQEGAAPGGLGAMIYKATPAFQPAQGTLMGKEVGNEGAGRISVVQPVPSLLMEEDVGNDAPESGRVSDERFVAHVKLESDQMTVRGAVATECLRPHDGAAPGGSGAMMMRGAEATECWEPPEGAAPGGSWSMMYNATSAFQPVQWPLMWKEVGNDAPGYGRISDKMVVAHAVCESDQMTRREAEATEAPDSVRISDEFFSLMRSWRATR
jgi:hypothetical protein